MKYADDTSLVVPQNSSVTLETEFAHLLDRTGLKKNKLKLNNSKTKEIVYHRPRLSRHIIPPPLPDIEQVTSAKILGVIFSHTLSPTPHISAFFNSM